jgi:bacterioferritin (cytochrome b1)
MKRTCLSGEGDLCVCTLQHLKRNYSDFVHYFHHSCFAHAGGCTRMSRDELHEASESLTRATQNVEDSALAERIEGLAAQLETLAEASRGPDQGRIDRLENALDEIETQLDDEAREQVREAHGKLREYRGTVGGI